MLYSDEPPSNWTSHSRGIQLYGKGALKTGGEPDNP